MKYIRKFIDPALVRKIEKIQKKLQMKENLKNGRKAKKITFSMASKEVAK